VEEGRHQGAKPTVADFETALHREIGSLPIRSLGSSCRLSRGITNTPLVRSPGRREWQRAGPSPESGRQRPARRPFQRSGSEAASRHRLRRRHRQVALVVLDQSVGDVDARDTRGVVQRQNRGPDRPRLARARPVHDQSRTRSVPGQDEGAHSAEPGANKTWRSMTSPGRSRNTDGSAACTNKGRRAFAFWPEGLTSRNGVGTPSRATLTDADTELGGRCSGNRRAPRPLRECLSGGRVAHSWARSRSIRARWDMTNKVQIAAWVKDHGED